MLDNKRGPGQPPKPYITKVFSIRHRATIIKKLRRRFTAKELQEKGQQWLDQLAEDAD